MLLALNNDLLQLIFRRLTYFDQRALRSTCKLLRRVYRYYTDIYARSVYDDFLHCPQGMLEEYKQFIAYGRLVFTPYMDRIHDFTHDITRSIIYYHSFLEEEETMNELYTTLKRGLYRAKHPPHITIRCAWMWDDALFIINHNNFLYRNNKLIARDVCFLTRVSFETYLIFDSVDVYLLDNTNTLMYCDKKPADTLFAGAYCVSARDGLIHRITLDGCLLQEGWSFPTGVIGFASGRLENTVSLVVVNTQHQAFHVICCDEKIIAANGFLEDIIDVVGCGSVFLLLNKEHNLISATFDGQNPVLQTQEGNYERLYVLGQTPGGMHLGQTPNGIFHVLAYADDGVDQLQVTCSPLEITRTRLSQNYGWSYPLPHGTYTIVY